MSTTVKSNPSQADMAGTAEGSPADNPWRTLAGLHPENTTYPARASFDGQGIVIFKTKTGFRGVQRSCPHMQATMLKSYLTADDTMVRCHLHVFTFRLSDGKGVNCPGYLVKVYEIKEENGVLYGRAAN
jgi:nitrite reductase/ring-hydroxylating ferredoxin subunit